MVFICKNFLSGKNGYCYGVNLTHPYYLGAMQIAVFSNMIEGMTCHVFKT